MTEPINWLNDPLLLDPEPLIENTWVTANDLIEQDKRELFQTATKNLLLYPIMIRKIDFISGERIIQSFPYILLNAEWITNIRKQSLTLAEKVHHYFKESNYNKSIRDWQKKIIQYLEQQQRLPFPLFRLTNDFEAFFLDKQFVQFQSARGEDFQLPLYLNEDLTYLTGVIMGDGHLAEYFVNIIDSSKEHIENLTQLLAKLFNSKTELFEQTNAKAWNVNILGKWLVRFFNFLSGQPINERKYPSLREPLLYRSNDLYRRAFWRGLMDADGSYKSTIGFGSASKQLRSDFADFLKLHNIHFRFYEQEVLGGKTFSLNIAGKSRKGFSQLIGSNHPQKQQELQILLTRKVNRFSQRVHTVRKNGTWQEQVINFNKEKLTNGFFDFSNLPLNIINIGAYLKELRLKHKQTQKNLAMKLNIVQGMLSKYEANIISIPIQTLIQILANYEISMDTILLKYAKIGFQSSKSQCYFPTKPNTELLNLMKGLQFKDNGYFYIIGHSKYSLEDYKQKLRDYFSITIPHSMKINNAVLNIFYKEFFILRN